MSEPLTRDMLANKHDDPGADAGAAIDRLAATALRIKSERDQLATAAEAVLPIFVAVSMSVGLGKNQLARIEALKAALAKARGEAA